jgi:methylthioribose-1-phosphate isomerase
VPEGFPARNPAFDVTPAALVSGVVTEVGVARRPYPRSLAAHVRRAAAARRAPRDGAGGP